MGTQPKTVIETKIPDTDLTVEALELFEDQFDLKDGIYQYIVIRTPRRVYGA